MSLSISYSATYASNSISSYLSAWELTFADNNHTSGNVNEDSNTGGFYPGYLSGTQYAISGYESTGAFVAEGTLSYNITTHVLSGDLDNVNLGGYLYKDASGYHLFDEQATFDGLGLSGTDVHNTIYALMSGNTGELEAQLNDILDDYGVSTDDSFDVVAAALAAGPLSTGSAETVGVPELADDLALAA